MHIGRRLKFLVEKKQLTVREFARQMNITEGYAHRIFNKENVNSRLLQKAGEILKVSVSDLLSPQLEAQEIKEEYIRPSQENWKEKYFELLEKYKEALETNQMLRDRLDKRK